ncbi:ferritin-like metal-binding protein YciE [Flavobacterium arsenatis]|uniref:Ferritin-like metal-binding protein YciE n=1 Tax=Flavobacterium arsenatis TaxID=1484332 RepID=A0ABU1TTV9_9FLAO|nr:ferritin-like domain-containing protein [Flavobacterium arsenatis]MDR6969308.1 ferritin-like metal-binding protein YciE [Flavobacterium arsenatis]
MKTTTKSTAKKSNATKSATTEDVATKTSTSKGTSTKGIVKAKSNAADGLRSLFEDSLKDIYWTEKALTKALPKMAKNATSPELKTALEDHLAETEEHIARLEKVFQSIGKKAVAKKCDAMEGLIKEGEGILEETEKGVVRDAGIIAAAQKVEHYEIATYGTLYAFANTLGESEAAELLASTLEEEKNADVALTEIALATINIEAAEQDEE